MLPRLKALTCIGVDPVTLVESDAGKIDSLSASPFGRLARLHGAGAQCLHSNGNLGDVLGVAHTPIDDDALCHAEPLSSTAFTAEEHDLN